jgi:hypothetical protein
MMSAAGESSQRQHQPEPCNPDALYIFRAAFNPCAREKNFIR